MWWISLWFQQRKYPDDLRFSYLHWTKLRLWIKIHIYRVSLSVLPYKILSAVMTSSHLLYLLIINIHVYNYNIYKDLANTSYHRTLISSCTFYLFYLGVWFYLSFSPQKEIHWKRRKRSDKMVAGFLIHSLPCRWPEYTVCFTDVYTKRR